MLLNIDQETSEKSKEVRRLLGLNPEASEFKVVYGSASANDGEVALLTRSILEILRDISSSALVPAEHVAEKRVNPNVVPEG